MLSLQLSPPREVVYVYIIVFAGYDQEEPLTNLPQTTFHLCLTRKRLKYLRFLYAQSSHFILCVWRADSYKASHLSQISPLPIQERSKYSVRTTVDLFAQRTFARKAFHVLRNALRSLDVKMMRSSDKRGAAVVLFGA